MIFADCFAADSNPERDSFLWRAYSAASLGIEDTVISNRHCEDLCAPIGEGPLAISKFMKLFLAENPFLSKIEYESPNQRGFVYFLMTLFSLTAPHLTSFLPREGMQELLNSEGGSKISIFQMHSLATFGVTISDPASTIKAAFNKRHYDPGLRNFQTITPSGSRIYANALQYENRDTVDIQLIGPLTRGLGVWESCRRLARALRGIRRYSTRFCEFDLDHPNETVGGGTELGCHLSGERASISFI
jgi:hypothetical protein